MKYSYGIIRNKDMMDEDWSAVPYAVNEIPLDDKRVGGLSLAFAPSTCDQVDDGWMRPSLFLVKQGKQAAFSFIRPKSMLKYVIKFFVLTTDKQ